MDEERLLKARLEKALREARNAENERHFRDQQMAQQQRHLDSLMNHRQECVNGLKSAKKSGLSIVQTREYQLLMQHLRDVVEEQQYKVEVSQLNFEQADKVWREKQQNLEQLQQAMQNLIESKQESLIEDGKVVSDATQINDKSARHADTLAGIAAKRLKTSSR